MIKKKPTTSLHYNIGQLRVDIWNALRSQSGKLAAAKKDAPEKEQQLAIVEASLKQLASI